jgi:hypothetical protein
MPAVQAKRGRPRKPREPKGPVPHDRREFADRLQAIMVAIEIEDLTDDVQLHLQKMLRRYDLLRATDAKRFPAKGAEQVTLLLRTVFESKNGAAALTLPILRAVLSCMRPAWVERGLEWIETFDDIDLVGLHSTLRELGVDDQFDRVLLKRLTDLLGPPVSAPQKQQPARRSTLRKPRRSAVQLARMAAQVGARRRPIDPARAFAFPNDDLCGR